MQNGLAMSDSDLARVQRKLSEIRYVLYDEYPFFGYIISRVPYEFSPVKTAACSNRGIAEGGLGMIHFDPRFLSRLTREEIAFVWIHEVFHLGLGYFPRLFQLLLGVLQDSPDWKVFSDRANRAHDHVINLALESSMALQTRSGRKIMAFPTCMSVLKDKRFTGKTFEEVYRILTEEEEAQPPVVPNFEQALPKSDEVRKSPTKAGDGPGKGEGASPEGETEDEKFSQPSGINDSTDCVYEPGLCAGDGGRGLSRAAEQFRQLLAEAMHIQNMRNAGGMPGGLWKLVQSFLEPKVSWIHRYLDMAEGFIRSEGKSYRKPSLRSQAAGMLLPGRTRRKPRIAIVTDTSASTRDCWSAFLGATRQIVETMDTEVRLIQVDTRVVCDQELEDFDQFRRAPVRFSGGGGTVFDDVPRRLRDAEDPVQLAILFTDGQPTHWPDYKEWPCPLVVVTVESLPPPSYPNVVQLDHKRAPRPNL